MKNSDTNQHDLVGVVSWGDGCAAVGMVNGHGDDKLFLMIKVNTITIKVWGRMGCTGCKEDDDVYADLQFSLLQDGMYGVYAEVAKLRDWIDGKISENGGATFCS